MDLGLAATSVLVTGGSRGIGRGIAEAFLDEGASVVVCGRTEADLHATRDALCAVHGAERIDAFAGDLTRPDAIAAALALADRRFGFPEIVVASVGTGRYPPGLALDEETWRAAFEANFWGAQRLLEAALPAMRARGHGDVVLIGSIAGLESIGAPLAYGTAKAALAALCKSAAREVAGDGIRINMIAPGNIMFDGGTWERKLKEDPEGVGAYVAREVPMNRFGTVREIADLCVFLGSRRAGFMTGSCVVADGGQTRGGYW